MRREFIVLPLVGLIVGTVFSYIYPEDKPLPAPVAEQEVLSVEQEAPAQETQEPVKEDEPVTKDGTIVMYTSDRCVWCVKWKACELAKIRAAGWKFEEVYTPDGPWPRFDVHGRGKVVRHVGYMSMSALKQIIGGM